MNEGYSPDAFYSRLTAGKLREAMAYLSQYPEQAALYNRYAARFQEAGYERYRLDTGLNDILLDYQIYYREAFYLEQPDAAEHLRGRLAARFGLPGDVTLDELEEAHVAEVFRAQGLHILTGRTSGWYGPYIWRREELARCAVALPGGTQDYAVKFLDDFVMLSWLDYLSFGAVSTGGWADSGGLIHCVKASYDLESENFRVSLLKHEAQHAQDLARYPGMTSEELEYRAKLVELIYSERRRLLPRFAREADASQTAGGHALAARRITDRIGVPPDAPIPEVRSAARKLFASSTKEAEMAYKR